MHSKATFRYFLGRYNIEVAIIQGQTIVFGNLKMFLGVTDFKTVIL